MDNASNIAIDKRSGTPKGAHAMVASKYPVVVVAGTPLTRAQTCTTLDCTAPRIRMNALKCAAHEVEYRAAAKSRRAARVAAAKAAAAKSNARTRRARTAAAPTPNAVANVDANGLRTTRPPRPVVANA